MNRILTRVERSSLLQKVKANRNSIRPLSSTTFFQFEPLIKKLRDFHLRHEESDVVHNRLVS